MSSAESRKFVGFVADFWHRKTVIRQCYRLERNRTGDPAKVASLNQKLSRKNSSLKQRQRLVLVMEANLPFGAALTDIGLHQTTA